MGGASSCRTNVTNQSRKMVDSIASWVEGAFASKHHHEKNDAKSLKTSRNGGRKKAPKRNACVNGNCTFLIHSPQGNSENKKQYYCVNVPSYGLLEKIGEAARLFNRTSGAKEYARKIRVNEDEGGLIEAIVASFVLKRPVWIWVFNVRGLPLVESPLICLVPDP
eukprot:jgi/Bigna1/144027/aug1.83_g18735